jgi:pyruvate dehydrogenase E1 component beta subunit
MPEELFFSTAITRALDEELARDPAVFLMGEDIGAYGGAFGVTRGLQEKYGEKRIRETPISEGSFTGIAVGAAAVDMRPVVELMFMDFLALALDQLLNSAAKLHYMYDGQVKVPLVLRAPGGAKGGYGASHSQMLTQLVTGIPGLKVVAPATPAQALGLLKSAIRDDNPVIFIENKRLYGMKGLVPDGEFLLPLDKAVVAAPGAQVTLVAYSAMVPLCLKAREMLQMRGVSAEVVDLVSLRPLDMATILESLGRTGRAVLVEEGCVTGGVMAEVAARIVAEGLPLLEAPVLRVGAADTPVPSSPDLERFVLPSAEGIVETALKTVQF